MPEEITEDRAPYPPSGEGKGRNGRGGGGRQTYKITLMALKAAKAESLFSRQDMSEGGVDQFATIYDKYKLLDPPYKFSYLQKIYEESDVLQTCVDAYKQNIDGFGYQLLFLGDDADTQARTSPEARAQFNRAKSFFDFANDKQSWTTVRKLLREDLEVLGNAALEVIRSNDGQIQMVYYLPFRNIRLAQLGKDPIEVRVSLVRDGKTIEVPIQRHFRRYCQIKESTGQKLRWFKEFGDPRPMDAKTGEFKEGKMLASELWHFKIHSMGQAYGIPRWLSCVLDVIGRRGAQYVNWDLFENQGIPPVWVTVSGGYLTDESWEELEGFIKSGRGVENFNKMAVLEANVASVGLDDRGTAKIEIKNMLEYRANDIMFSGYLKETKAVLRERFRLAPLYIGDISGFNRSTSESSQEVTEEQVFIPMRAEFDELVNRYILTAELGVTLWAYKSKGPQVVGSEEIARGVRTFGEAGGLTINHTIDLANKAFGLEMSKFDHPWANFPLPIVMEMMRQGTFPGVEELVKIPPTPKPIGGSEEKPGPTEEEQQPEKEPETQM